MKYYHTANIKNNFKANLAHSFFLIDWFLVSFKIEKKYLLNVFNTQSREIHSRLFSISHLAYIPTGGM